MGVDKEKVESHADKKALIDIWKTTVQTQMHFNEMLQKVRFIGLTIVIGVMGAAAETLRIESPVQVNFLFLRDIHIAAIIQLFALLLWIGLIFLEIYFFGLLIGAVEYGEQIEKSCKMLEGGLTNRITLSVSKRKAQKLLFVFYAVPLGGGLYFLITLFTL